MAPRKVPATPIQTEIATVPTPSRRKKAKAAEEQEEDENLDDLVKQARESMIAAANHDVAEKKRQRVINSDLQLSTSLRTDLDQVPLLIDGVVLEDDDNVPAEPVTINASIQLKINTSVSDTTEKLDTVPPRHVGAKAKATAAKKHKLENDTAGPGWFDLPATKPTDDILQHLKVLKMREVLDTKHFFKGKDSKSLPKYFQVGKFIDDPTEYYAEKRGRVGRKAVSWRSIQCASITNIALHADACRSADCRRRVPQEGQDEDARDPGRESNQRLFRDFF